MSISKNITWRVEQIFYGTPKTKSGCYLYILLPTGESEVRIELAEKELVWARNNFRRNKNGKLVKITKRTPEWIKSAIVNLLSQQPRNKFRGLLDGA